MEISIILYAVLKLYLIFNIYQQAHYQIKYYLKHFLLNLVFYDLIPLVLLILGNVLDYIFIQVICSMYLICFGVFPAVFLYYLGINTTLGIIILIFYILCALIRLAFFNVLETKRQTKGGFKSVFK